MKTIEFKIYVRNPCFIFLYFGVIFLCLWLVAPIDFVYSGSPDAVFIGFAMVVLFAFGLQLGFGHIYTKALIINLRVDRIRKFVNLLALLGAIGFLLRIFEKVYLRAGGAVTTDFVANRELLDSGGNGVFALVGGVLVTMLLILPLGIMLLRRAGESRKRYYVLTILSVLYPVSDVLLQGSRSTLVIYVGVYVASIMTMSQQRIQLMSVVRVLFVVVFLGWVAGQIFALRTTQMGLDPVLSMYISGYSYFAPASEEVTNYLTSKGVSGFGGLLYAYVHISQYFLHGVYEFFYLASHVTSPTTYGMQGFYIPLKVIYSLFGGENIETVIASGVLRPGVYTTLFGPMVYDYGPFGGVVASLLFGVGAGAIAKLVSKGRLKFLPLYLIIIGFLPFAFVANLFVSGTGQYSLLATLILYIILSLKRFRLDVPRNV